MGQKVNPISLRLQRTNREFDNSWYTNYFYKKLLSRDLELQQYLNSFLKLVKSPEARLAIQYTQKNIRLFNFSCYPKQSRELRSKIFGLSYIKRKKTKKKLQTIFFSQNQQIKIRKESLKYLINQNLWNRLYTIFFNSPSICFILESQLQQSFYNISCFFYLTKKKHPFLIFGHKTSHFDVFNSCSNISNSCSDVFNSCSDVFNSCSMEQDPSRSFMYKRINNEQDPSRSFMYKRINNEQDPSRSFMYKRINNKISKTSFFDKLKIDVYSFINKKSYIKNNKSVNNYLFNNSDYFFFPCIHLLITETISNKKIDTFYKLNENTTSFYHNNKKSVVNFNNLSIQKINGNSKIVTDSKIDLTNKNLQKVNSAKKTKINYNVIFNQYIENLKQKNDLLLFLKDFITTLFLLRIKKQRFNIKNIKTDNIDVFTIKNNKSDVSSLLFDKKDHKQKKINKNSQQITKNNFTTQLLYYLKRRQYKKNCLKSFLVCFILYQEYNKNIDINLLINFYKKNIKYLYNSKNCFFNFQTVSMFHTVENFSTPIYLLLKTFFTKNQSIRSIEFKSSNHHNLSKNKKDVYSFINKKSSIKNNKEYPYIIDEKSHSPFDNVYNYLDVYNQIIDKIKPNNQHLKYNNYLQYHLWSQFNINMEYFQFIVLQDWQSAGFLADEIVYFLERRITFRRLKNKIIKKIAENPSIRGIRITCSGRVGGKSKKAQRAKTECIKYGQTSRHTFSSRIDFAHRTARTLFGSVGIKVWICYK